MSPLIAIAATLFPEIIKAIAGDRAGTVADSVTRAVTNSVKTNNPVQAQQQLARIRRLRRTSARNWRRSLWSKPEFKLDDEQRQREAALGRTKDLRGI